MDGKNGPLAAEPPVSLSYDISYDKEKIALTPLFHFQPSFNFSSFYFLLSPCYSAPMLFQKKFQKGIRIFWTVISLMVIVSMVLLYSAPAFF